MSSAPAIFARWLHSLALALWLGGLVAIGALVAPTAFHVARSSPDLAGNPTLQTALAGGIVGSSLRLFNVVCYVCGGALLLADILLLRERAGRGWTAAGFLAALLLLGSALYLGLSLFPSLDLAQQRHETALFDQLHVLYERLSLAQLPLLLLLALLTAARDTSIPRHLPPAHAAPEDVRLVGREHAE